MFLTKCIAIVKHFVIFVLQIENKVNLNQGKMIQLQVQTTVGVDLNSLPTDKLVQIREQADLRIKSRQKRKNALIADLLLKDNNCHTRIGFCVAKLLGKKLKEITLSEISGLRKSTFLNMPNMGVKSLIQLNAILLANGYAELTD